MFCSNLRIWLAPRRAALDVLAIFSSKFKTLRPPCGLQPNKWKFRILAKFSPYSRQSWQIPRRNFVEKSLPSRWTSREENNYNQSTISWACNKSYERFKSHRQDWFSNFFTLLDHFKYLWSFWNTEESPNSHIFVRP